MNREDRRAWGCFRHTPPNPIVSAIMTLPEAQSHDMTIQLGQVWCAVCKQPPLIKEIQVDRKPKSPSRIIVPTRTVQ
jgi:hypothetical protein